jgi:maltooligosyltrehalose trehalohydrolase
VRALLVTRRKMILPRLAGASFGSAQWNDGVLTADWRLGNDSRLSLLANLSDAKGPTPQMPCGTPIWGGTPGETLPPWSVFWSIGAS